MRKFILTISFTAVSMAVFCQDALTYTDVVQVDSISKSQLYNRARIWFATTYNSANDVIQIENKDEGEIIGKAIMKYNPNVNFASEQTKGNIKYTIKIYVKDGRYKYEITDFIHDPYGNHFGKSSVGLITTEEECPNPKPKPKGWSNKVWKDIKTQIEDNINSILSSLKEGMGKISETKKDDW